MADVKKVFEQSTAKYITVTLTEDQLRAIQTALESDLAYKSHHAEMMQMGLDPQYIAFNKRLRTTLAQAKS